MRKIGAIAVLFSFSALVSCGGSGSGGYSTDPGGGGNQTCPANTVCMRASTFSPTQLTVTAGTDVTFSNNSGIEHNVVFDPPLSPNVADVGDITSGTAVRSFSTAGTFAFHCTIHAGMSGKIVVN
jgi:plastocyanin